jgi:hypothetical protein
LTVFESNVAKVTVTPQTITIEHKKGTYHSGKVKDIRIKSISGVEIKKPGTVMAGYIQFIFSGGKESGGRYRMDAAKNENTVMFRKKEYDSFLECKRLIDQYIEEAQSSKPAVTTPTSSDADELKKWADLREAGAISDEEYDSKKKQILGL